MKELVLICMLIIIVTNVYTLVMRYIRKKIRPKVVGKIGESIQTLRLELLNKNEYITLNSILIRDDSNRTHQIDHIVFSKYGIFVIETKNYSGTIYDRNDGKMWIQYINGNRTDFYSPVYQNYGHLLSLSKLLNLPKEKFKSIVAFSASANITKVKSKSVIHSSKLLSEIKKYKKIIIDEDICKYAEILMKNNITIRSERKWHVKNIKQNSITMVTDIQNIKLNDKKQKKENNNNKVIEVALKVNGNPKLYEEIRKWRATKAAANNSKSYFIFNNKTLKALSEANIQNKEDLLKVYGIGNTKYNLYADELYSLIRYSTPYIDKKIVIEYYDKVVVVDNEKNVETYIIIPSYFEGRPIASSIYYPKSKVSKVSDADISKNELSDQSIVGKTLLGKQKGETVTIRLDGESYQLYIKDIIKK